MADKVTRLYDSFFKRIFSEVPNVRDFLMFILPEALRQRLDLDELRLDPTSYVAEDYRQSFSDMVVRCKRRDGAPPMDIYFLFEHKSFPEKGTVLQILNYKQSMWKKDERENKPFRAVVSIRVLPR